MSFLQSLFLAGELYASVLFISFTYTVNYKILMFKNFLLFKAGFVS